MLPGQDGIDHVHLLRASEPFDPAELLAQVQVVLTGAIRSA